MKLHRVYVHYKVLYSTLNYIEETPQFLYKYSDFSKLDTYVAKFILN